MSCVNPTSASAAEEHRNPVSVRGTTENTQISGRRKECVPANRTSGQGSAVTERAGPHPTRTRHALHGQPCPDRPPVPVAAAAPPPPPAHRPGGWARRPSRGPGDAGLPRAGPRSCPLCSSGRSDVSFRRRKRAPERHNRPSDKVCSSVAPQSAVSRESEKRSHVNILLCTRQRGRGAGGGGVRPHTFYLTLTNVHSSS